MQPAVKVKASGFEALVDGFVGRRKRSLGEIATRVKLVVDGDQRWIGALSSKGAIEDGQPEFDVELIGSEAVLRAVLARPRHAVALLLLGRLRVRGHLHHIDALSKLAAEETR